MTRRYCNDNGLTNRENEIVNWLAEGKSNRQIGKYLRISHSTVNSHLKSVNQKWGTNGRHTIVLKAYGNGTVK